MPDPSLRYVAAWRQPRDRTIDGSRDPRVFDVSKLPDDFPEVTADVKQEGRCYLTQGLGAAGPDGTAWFRLGDESLAQIDLQGEPAA